MEAHLQAQIAFHLTGTRSVTTLEGIDEPRLDYIVDAFGRFMAGERVVGASAAGR